MTSDHIPKLVSPGPNAISAFGYSGRGIAPGTAFGTAAARALLNKTNETLPLPVRSSYEEQFTDLKRIYYETGAILTHLTSAR